MKRYEALGRDFDEIYDLIALRIITDTVADCYSALGIVHSIWRPVQGQFDDYIASPKENLYQSLHTSVMGPEGSAMEVQIRTKEMHRLAEDGVAAHWVYKEGEEEPARLDDKFEQKLSWLKQLIEWQREVQGDQEYLDTVKTDILRDQVFVYTPAGEVKELPAGATPLDFAFRIHTELGLNCVGAYVNGKSVPLNTKLSNGDTVRVRKSFTDRGPSLDWLNSGPRLPDHCKRPRQGSSVVSAPGQERKHRARQSAVAQCDQQAVPGRERRGTCRTSWIRNCRRTGGSDRQRADSSFEDRRGGVAA